jgi:hypothetical protein
VAKNHVGGAQDIFFRNAFIDHPAKPLGTGLGSD